MTFKLKINQTWPLPCGTILALYLPCQSNPFFPLFLCPYSGHKAPEINFKYSPESHISYSDNISEHFILKEEYISAFGKVVVFETYSKTVSLERCRWWIKKHGEYIYKQTCLRWIDKQKFWGDFPNAYLHSLFWQMVLLNDGPKWLTWTWL